MRTEGVPAWIYSPFPGQVRWSTVVACAGVFAVLLVAGGRPGEAWWLRPLRAVTVAMVALCGYEIAYQAIGVVVHRWSFGTVTLTAAGTGGWLVAAAWIGVRPDWRLLALCAAVWVGWIAAGFESNMPDRIIPGAAFHWSWTDEAFNVSTKTLLALALLVGTLRSELDHLEVGADQVECGWRGRHRRLQGHGAGPSRDVV